MANLLVEDLGNGLSRRTRFNAPAVMAPPAVYSDATRPSATLFSAGEYVWNTDDNAPNFSSGVDWYDAMGTLT